MVSASMVLLALVEILVISRLGDPRPFAPRRWLLWLVGIGLAYDSAIFGLGALIGEGALLESLSWFRFLGHAILTPLLVVWAGWRYAESRAWRAAALVTAAVLVVWGFVTDVWGLHLVVRTFADTVRYAHEHPAPPVPAIVVILVLLVVGAIAWRRDRRPALLIGSVVMLFAAGAGAAVPPLGNVGEAVLLAGIVVAERGSLRREVGSPEPVRRM